MKVLIADDSLLSRRLLEDTLKKWGYQVLSAQDGLEAWSHLSSEEPPALAILDWMMPGFTGPELCRMIRDRGGEPYIYTLLLTSRNEREDVVAGLDSGADDYITKPFDRHELQVRLRAGSRIIDLQAQLVSAREELRIQATRDYLTQVWNRSAVIEILQRELARLARQGSPVSVLLADIDHFKSINDTYGHVAGDLALREVVSRFQAAMRPYDALGRYGGEEFLMVLPGTDERGCLAQAERMRHALGSQEMHLGSPGMERLVTCSFGCTTAYHPNVPAQELIQRADEALYKAKRLGRNRAEYLAPIFRVTEEEPEASAVVAATGE